MSDLSAQQQQEYYLGVDCGGSKTLASIVNSQGQEVGRGQAGSSNHTQVGLEQAMRALHLAVERAALAACSPLPLSKAWLGIGGYIHTRDYDTFFPHVCSLANVVHMTNDGELGLCALEKHVGVALVAGTGSIALGRDASGHFARSGGWGYLLGNEGSGYTISQQAIVAALRAADRRGPSTLLLDLMLEHWQMSQPEAILAQVYVSTGRANVAAFSRSVFAAARLGDSIAQEIVERGAYELALAAKTTGEKLGFVQTELPLALLGGLLVYEADYREKVLAHIRTSQPLGQVVVVENPALSAARAARRLSESGAV